MPKLSKMPDSVKRLIEAGISPDDAYELRRISMTLRGWFELCCGTDAGHIERDEATGKPFWRRSSGERAYPTPDREAGAMRRLKRIMNKYPFTFRYYIQGDCRGIALYIFPPSLAHIPTHEMESRYPSAIGVDR